MSYEKENLEKLELMGIDKLHDLSHKGQGWNVLIYEDTDESHRLRVAENLSYTALESNIYHEYFGVKGETDGQQLIDFVHQNNIKVVNISLASNHSYPDFNIALKQLRDEGVIIFCGAGNEGADGHKGIGHDDNIAIMVGAGTNRDGGIYKDPYSGIDEEMDFMSLKKYGYSGTSFASPWLAGMVLCLLNYFGDINADQIYSVLKSICQDMGDEGRDDYTGWGIPIIDLEKLAEMKEQFEKIIIELTIDSNKAYVNEEEVILDVPATLIEGRTLVPLRLIAESLGSDVYYESATKKIYIDGDKIVLTVGSINAYVDGELVVLDVPAQVINGRALVPIRFVGESLGCEVTYIASAKKVIIVK